MLRRVGAIGDIHAEDELLADALSHMKGLDAVLAVGDIVDGFGDVNRTCALLREHGVQHGLPVTRHFETPRGRLLLSHGLGENDMAGLRSFDEGYALESNLPLGRLLSDGAQELVLFGHTHERMVRRIAPVTFINAGTLHPTREAVVLPL